MKLALIFGSVLALLGLTLAAWIRLAPDDPARRHADPMAGERTGRPNDSLRGPMPGADAPAPVWAATPEALMQAMAEVAGAAPRTALLAGGAEALHATWVQRSRLMAFPDYVSVRALPAEGGATLAIWSRSRYGHSDLGVNAARVEDWLSRIALPRAQP